MNRGDKLLSVYKGFGFEHDLPNHFLDGDALHVYSAPTKIEKDPVCILRITLLLHIPGVTSPQIHLISGTEKEGENLRADRAMASSYRKKSRIGPQAEPPSESEGDMSLLLMKKFVFKFSSLCRCVFNNLLPNCSYMLHVPKEGLCHFYLSMKGRIVFLSNK